MVRYGSLPGLRQRQRQVEALGEQRAEQEAAALNAGVRSARRSVHCSASQDTTRGSSPPKVKLATRVSENANDPEDNSYQSSTETRR